MDTATLRPIAFETLSSVADGYRASATSVRFVDVPACRYLTIDGQGAPGDLPFRESMAALYPVAYTLHFALKSRGVSAPVGALEFVMWPTAGRATGLPSPGDWSKGWQWRLMLPVPAAATREDVLSAEAEVLAKKDPAALPMLRLDDFAEGPAAQILHVGPYDAEAPTIERLHRAIRDAHLRVRGHHHEIYISDPNRTASQNLKTVIRQPVEPA